MVSKIESENMSKLRVLADKLCYGDPALDNNVYKRIVNDIRSIIESENENVDKIKNNARIVKILYFILTF